MFEKMAKLEPCFPRENRELKQYVHNVTFEVNLVKYIGGFEEVKRFYGSSPTAYNMSSEI